LDTALSHLNPAHILTPCFFSICISQWFRCFHRIRRNPRPCVTW
jgi:hypothetical protein